MDINKYHIATTINPATAVTNAIKGYFINSLQENLIVSKGSTIEIYSILNEGIKLLTHFSIYGVVDRLSVCHLPDRETCSLFILTDQKYFTIVTYSSRTETIVTEGHGILTESQAKITDQSTAIAMDTRTNTMLVSAFTGYLFSIPLAKEQKLKAKRFSPESIRTNEFDFLDMVALKGIQQSSVAVLLGEINELKTIKIFRYSSNEMVENEKLTMRVEATTHMLISVPDPIGGVLAIGEYILSYHDLSSSGRETKELSIDPVMITSYTFLENSYDTCMLGDSEGYLYLLTLEVHNMKVINISSTTIGQIPIPSSIVDLGRGLFYAGSTKGDSCVFRLNKSHARTSVCILHTFHNLGPIIDFCLFDYDQQGKQTMVCCSGVDRNGSLRVVENGVGFTEQYSVDIPLIKDVWALHASDRQKQNALLITTFDQTVFLKHIQHTEFREYTTYASLDLQQTTLASITTQKGHLVQITPTFIRLMQHDEHGRLLDEWKPPVGQFIALAELSSAQCVVCCGSNTLVCFALDDNLYQQSTRKVTDDHVACIKLSLGKENGIGKDCVMIGTWKQRRIQVLSLPQLVPLLEHTLQKEIGPTDLVLVQFDKTVYLLVLFGDGQLLSYVYKNKLLEERQTVVGTYCTSMHAYQHRGETKVFITGSRPTIVTHLHGTLYFSAVNLKDMYRFTSFNDHMILMTPTGLMFGEIDLNQRLHHTKIVLENEMPIRIRYMPQLKLLAVGTTMIFKNLNNNFLIRKGKLNILDAQTLQGITTISIMYSLIMFIVLDSYTLSNEEVVESMTVARFPGYQQDFLFVGTAIPDPDDPEASRGRILVFDIKETHTCELIEAIDMSGVIYDMRSCHGSIVACVNGSIFCLSSFRPDLPLGARVKFDLNIHRNVLALCLDVRDDRVLVGDLMRSMSVLQMLSKDPLQLELLAVDSKPVWMTAVKFVNDHVYIGADDRNNLFTLILDEQKKHNGMAKLELTSGFHVGSLVNCFRQGTLVDITNEDTHTITQSIEPAFTYATVHGSIGVVKTISKEAFEFFKQIQNSILKESQNIGKLDYVAFRSYRPKINSQHHHFFNQEESDMPSYYLDGDVLKLF
ncbi:DNA damage-binding protein 1a, partial [Rhizopus stolonifer]